jgi:copper homeostasis protein
MMQLEICVDSVESAVAAEQGGAQRVELCSALAEGGLTPSAGLIREVRSSVGIGVHVMIRPRGGDFLYTDNEYKVMQDDIAFAAQCGAHGVVFGLLTADGNVDALRTRALVQLAQPMEVTFHRALDMTRDPSSALEAIIESGADRVLTSGAEPTALLGHNRIQIMMRAAGSRIKIMVGGGVRPQNVREIAARTGAVEFHAALRKAVESPVTFRNRKLHMGDPGSDEYSRTAVHASDVRALRQAIEAAGTFAANPAPTSV